MENKTEILSDNELIAQFMAISHQVNDFQKKEFHLPDAPKGFFGDYVYELRHVRYNESWDWLMPVVEKILDTEFCGKFEEWKNLVNKIHNAMIMVSIDEVHKAVVEFIRWFNSQSPATIK